jgi:copper chaperone CopZ
LQADSFEEDIFNEPGNAAIQANEGNEERLSVIKMVKIVLTVEGMMCGMCEAHINDAVRTAFPVKKVTSSHTKGQTVILTEQEIDEAALRAVINKTGYTVVSVTREPYVKKGLFSFGK